MRRALVDAAVDIVGASGCLLEAHPAVPLNPPIRAS
jgi:hypothetical protein